MSRKSSISRFFTFLKRNWDKQQQIQTLELNNKEIETIRSQLFDNPIRNVGINAKNVKTISTIVGENKIITIEQETCMETKTTTLISLEVTHL